MTHSLDDGRAGRPVATRGNKVRKSTQVQRKFRERTCKYFNTNQIPQKTFFTFTDTLFH